MTRKDFFELIGVSIPSALTFCSVGSCTKSNTVPSGKIDFSIDLNDPLYNKLVNMDSFVFINKGIDIIIAHTVKNEYVAVSARCTHQGSLVAYYTSDMFFCSKHGASYDTKGNVTQGPAVSPLQHFSTELNGSMLRVYS